MICDLHAYCKTLHDLITMHDKWKLKPGRKYHWLKDDHIKFCPGYTSVYFEDKICHWA